MTESTAPRRGLLRRPPEAGPRARFRQLLPYLGEHRGVIALVIVLSLVGAATSLAQPLLVGRVIELVQAGEPLGGLIGLLIGLVIAAGLITGFQHYLLQRTGTSVVFSARRQLVRRMLRLPISEFDRRRTGDLVSRVGSDTTLLYAVITQGLVDAVGGAAVFIGAIVAMLLLDAVLLGLTVLVVALSLGAVIGIASRLRGASQQQQERVGDLAAAVERAIGAIRTVRAANATDRESDAIERDAVAARNAGFRVARISALVVPIGAIAPWVSFLIVIGVGGYRVASGEVTIAELVAFILFLVMMIAPLGQAFGAITSVNQALGALGRIREIIEIPSETEGDAETAAAPPVPSGSAIAFEAVSFSYPSDALPPSEDPTPDGTERRSPEPEAESGGRGVLHEVSFEVPRGSRVALVGPSGAGKSTIFALIERFYDPVSGVVRLDGRDVRGMPRDELRSRIGYVEQDAPVLAGSLRDNLTLAAPDATDTECAAVLRAVNLGDVLDRSELGLSAPVGEDGVMLSGGERQRLAIARALLAAPPILLLDESTSSLDGLNEQLLREAIDAVAEDRTLLVIAHRLSTVVDSDRIVVLEHGRVVGIGTHSELIASTPLYRDLAKRQLLV
jgi:ABC-type multidrug transport system fused ATPase/permease subunit